MAVFRVEKTKDFTVMSNHHLRNVSLSLKAKGLLSLMLSLLDNWDYTTKGLAHICKDGVDSISSAIKELEKQGYLTRQRLRDAHGRLGDIEYVIHEKPVLPDEQDAIALGGNRYATFLQMDADQLHTLEQDPRLSYVGASISIGSLELTPSLNLGLTEYLGDNASIYPSNTHIKEGRLPQAPMEIALPEDVLQYLGIEGEIGDKITLSPEKSLRHNIADSYSYSAEFVLTGILQSNYLG